MRGWKSTPAHTKRTEVAIGSLYRSRSESKSCTLSPIRCRKSEGDPSICLDPPPSVQQPLPESRLPWAVLRQSQAPSRPARGSLELLQDRHGWSVHGEGVRGGRQRIGAEGRVYGRSPAAFGGEGAAAAIATRSAGRGAGHRVRTRRAGLTYVVRNTGAHNKGAPSGGSGHRWIGIYTALLSA